MSSGEANIIEFISSLEEYSGAIPDQVIEYYLQRTGFSSQDIKVKRLIGIAAQKFVSDLIHDSLQYCKLRQDGKKDKRTVLGMEDLAQSASEYGITIKKPEYYSDKPGGLSTTTETQQ